MPPGSRYLLLLRLERAPELRRKGSLRGADGRLSARDLVAVGRAVRFLGRTDPDLFHDALRAFDEAASADPGCPLHYVGGIFFYG